MSSGDKHLDAEWKRIQKKTFTRWTNEHLKAENLFLEDLTTDLSDGVRMIVLIEVLSHKKLGRYNKKPRVYAQKMENVQMALDFLMKKERIRLVNIGSGDIVDKNLKLILGLIWTLILHYQISMGFGIGDDRDNKATPKQALMSYLQGLIPDVEMNNLTKDWNDGTKIAAVVDAMAPGLCPEHADMKPENALENATLAMKLAEDWLGVPMVLEPKDMCNPNVDELSMMTYLSQFPEAKLKPGAPIKTRAAADKVKVYGPGVEGNLDTNAPSAEFTIDVTAAGGPGKPSVSVTSPEGALECSCDDNKDGTFSCAYIPTVPGNYTVCVDYDGKPAAKSPYQVNIVPGADAGACRAYGPGVEGGDLRVGSPTEFWVETDGAGEGKLGITVRGTKGPIRAEDLIVEAEAQDKYHVQYTPQHMGPHNVEVTFSGLHIPQSPFKVRVCEDRPDASKCRVEGPGLQPNGVEIKQPTWFNVITKGAGHGDLSVHIKGPRGTVDYSTTEQEKGVEHFAYTANNGGEHVITIKYGGEQIPGSRFKVQVEPPTDPSKVVAYGPGLAPQGVRVKEPAKFTVKTKDAGHGNVGVKISGPRGELPFQVESAPYTHNYTYTAEEPGEYKVDISFDDKPISQSPYCVAITDASKVEISGPGLNGESLAVGSPLAYQVDARGAGPGELKCTVQDASVAASTDTTDGQGPTITDNGDGTFTIEHTPSEAGMKKMNVTFGEATVPNTPVKLNLFDASRVTAYGPGLEPGLKSGEQTHFTVDMRKAGEADLQINVTGPTVTTPAQIKDQANGMVRCEYTPTEAGDYRVDVQYGGAHIPNSPYTVQVRPSTDLSKVKAYGPGLEAELTTDMWAEFFVDYKEAGDGEPAVEVQGPGGGEDLEVEDIEPGLKKYRYFIDPEEAGQYTVQVDFADQAVPGSPFRVMANWKTDPSRVKASGPGLEGGISGDWTEFNIDMSKAGEGALGLQIEGPCEAQVDVRDNKDGTATVCYNPVEPGTYQISILFADKPIPGSVFTPVFDPPTDSAKVKAYGPGLEKDGVKVGDAGDFTIDTREAGVGAVDVAIDGPYWRGRSPTPVSPGISPGPTTSRSNSLKRPKSAAAKPKITSNNNNTYSVQYNPRKVGKYNINVFFAEDTIPTSPYEVNVSDPSRVKISGAGVTDEAAATDQPAALTFSHPLEWTVDCTEAGPGNLEATLYGPSGYSKQVPITKVADEVYHLKAEQPEEAGRYRLDVKYSGSDVKQSPVKLSLRDASRVKVSGSGLAGGRVGDTLSVDVDSSTAGEGALSLALSGPEEVQITCNDNKDGTATLTFTPTTAGEYKLDVKFSDEEVPGSEFCMPVIDPSRAIAYGSGVTGSGARVGAPAEVVVDTRNAGPVEATAELTTPSGHKESVALAAGREPGVFVGEYQPTEPGVYSLEVQCADEAIPKSPFSVAICDPDAVRLEGPGLYAAVQNSGNVVDVFTEGAGPGEIECAFTRPDGSPMAVESEVVKVDDTHYQLHYSPLEAGVMQAQVTYSGLPVGSQLTIPVGDLSKVKVEGLETELVANRPTEFVVDATAAGPAEMAVEVTDASGAPVATETETLAPQKWKVKYTPTSAGRHTVGVKYCGQDVPDSPFAVSVCDPSAVQAYGPGLEGATATKEARFTVDASEAGSGALGLVVSGPTESKIECKETSPGKYEVCYVPTRPGIYKVDLKFAGEDVKGSVFRVPCEGLPPDASKCVVRGLETPGSLTVDCSEAGGTGSLEVGVCGAYVPAEFVSVKHNGDYTFSVTYDIPEPGETQVSVKWHGQHLTGSPFTVITQ